MDDESRTQTEEQLRISEERFRRMAETIADVYFLIDARDDRVVYTNPAFEYVWGSSCSTAGESSAAWLTAVLPNDQAAARAAYESAKQGRKAQVEFGLRRPDGSLRWIELRCYPVPDGAGSIGRVSAVARDITDHRRAEQELHESERRFREMLGSIELASVMLDREARILFCNDFLLRLSGWQREEVMGRNWFELFIPSQFDGTDFFARILDNAPPAWHRENRMLTRAGQPRMMRWHSVVLRSTSGGVVGSASIGEDITERQLADGAVARRAAELERFHRLSIGRELQMIELKREVNALAKRAGQQPPYDLSFIDTIRPGDRPTREHQS